ncbi:MAG: type II toxin-antitoxin system ParD family antitoxin [Pirellulales bacterium]|nr:type II toxin-antitoxin system ParD family antitoxin [Pirellulales bacterium]
MTVNIPAEHQKFVQAVIRRGSYQSEDEVIGEALRLLRKREKRIAELRKELQPAVERLERGEGIELDENSLGPFLEKIKAEGDRILAERKQHKK